LSHAKQYFYQYYVNLEVHADYFVRIKTEQIKPILQVILQLYDGQSQDIKVGGRY
jgi:hypothetical protein